MNGVYGTKKPAFITSADVDIFYYYRPTRSTESADFTEFKPLDSECLMTTNYNSEVLPGMYNLRLPLNLFGSKGFYTIYIKPKEIYTTILDVSVLAAYPTVRGIVISSSDLSVENGGLVGYRVEYLDDDYKRTGEFRIITSNNRCEPLMKSVSNVNEKNITYRYNNSSNLMFCTLTPSTAMSFKSDALPNIGNTNQAIILTNTKFNPVTLEVEMVDNDINTLATMIGGDQTRNLEKGLITTFNSDGAIYLQQQTGRLTDNSLGINHDFRINKTTTVNSEELDRYNDIKDTMG